MGKLPAALPDIMAELNSAWLWWLDSFDDTLTGFALGLVSAPSATGLASAGY